MRMTWRESGDQVRTPRVLRPTASEPRYPNPVDGQSTFEFYVPQALAGRIIGRGGEVLKQCRDQFQANVQAPSRRTDVLEGPGFEILRRLQDKELVDSSDWH